MFNTLLLALLGAVVAALGTVGCRDGDNSNPEARDVCGHLPELAESINGERLDNKLPDSATTEEVVALLERHESANYATTYVLCGDSEVGRVSGTIRLAKEGVTRARTETELSLGGQTAQVTELAIDDSRGPRRTTCSPDLGHYFDVLLGGTGAAINPAFDEYLTLGATCVDVALDLDDDNVLTVVDPASIFPPRSREVQRSPDIYAPNAAIRKNDSGACLTFEIPDYEHEEYCFDEVGRFVSSTRSAEGSVSRVEVAGGTFSDVVDSDFEPPYAVEPLPEDCPYETPWQRAEEPVARPTLDVTSEPPLALALEYRDALVRFMRSAYTGTYRVCTRDSETEHFDGIVIWQKDGTERDRFDIRSDDGERTVSYHRKREGETFWCSAALGDEVGKQVLGSNREDIPAVKDLLRVDVRCPPDSSIHCEKIAGLVPL